MHLERLQCYSGVTEEQAIGRFDESLQRLYMDFTKAQHGNWQDLQGSLKGRDFFRAGPLMRALEYERPCVLLIDELDKVAEGFEAQAFKRACSCFGLGRYFYDVHEQWVELDDYKRPKQTPKLSGANTPAQRQQQGTERAINPGASRVSPKLAAQIEGYKKELGESLFQEILTVIGKAQTARSLSSDAVANNVLQWMERGTRGIQKARDLGADLSVGEFDHVLSSQRISTLNRVPTMKALSALVVALEAFHGKPQAA
jgi:hypothetical protein